MIRVFILILTFFLSLGLIAQENWTMKIRQDFQLADFAFYQEDFAYAHKMLTKVYESDTTYGPLLYEYGATLIQLNKDSEFAKDLLSKAAEKEEKEAVYWLAQALHLCGEHEEAINKLEEYAQFSRHEIDDAEIERQFEIFETSIKLKNDAVDVKVQNLGTTINTAFKEYVPLITADGQTLYFTSRRYDKKYTDRDPNNEFFENIYTSKLVDDQWEEAELMSSHFNTKTHDATVAVSGDGNSMIIYRTNKKLTGGDLYLVEKSSGIWRKPKKLNDNINSNYQEASATLSSDGTVMYFSSTRPGGYGGKDLYVVRKLPTGDWSKAMNLGPTINSPFDEDAPFINYDGTQLYFSSNGHETMGGYDIFKSKLNDEFWSRPENLGYPLNTVRDELYLTLNKEENIGFYASDQSDGHGSLDIYQVEMTHRKDKNYLVFSEVIDENMKPVEALVTVYDQDKNDLQGIYNTNPNTGKFMMDLNPDTKYKLLFEAEGFQMKILEFETDPSLESITQEMIKPFYLTTKK